MLGWQDIAARAPAGLSALRVALIEHELCVRAPIAFAGAGWSTWSNLIGARRWALGDSMAAGAYIDLDTAAPSPACAVGAVATGASTPAVRARDEVRRAAQACRD